MTKNNFLKILLSIFLFNASLGKADIINLQNTKTPSNVIVEKVNFKRDNFNIVGSLYLPKNKKDNIPAIVVTGAWTTVKEQMAGTYARELAKKGFAALTFDFVGWGESDGILRFIESPKNKTLDIKSAINFLTNDPRIDKQKIYGLGICASSGYMVDVAASNIYIKKLALVAPWLHTPAMAKAIYGGEDSYNSLVNISKTEEKKDKPAQLVAASTTDKKSVMFKAPYYTEKNRGFISEYDNKFSSLSWKEWLTYDAHKSAESLNKPLIVIGGDDMALPNGYKLFEDKTSAKIKKVWINGKNQFEFYDDKEIVQKSTESISKFFN